MNESSGSGSNAQSRDSIAPVWHTVVLLVVLAALAILGALAQRNVHAPGTSAAAPPRLVPLQIQAIVFEWLTLVWVWFGGHLRHVRMRDLVGGRWPDTRAVFVDLGLAAGLWVVWVGVTRIVVQLFGRTADTIPYPANVVEGLLAVAVAASAGFCEEVVFRGYLQRQFRAWSGSTVAAVVLQAAVFGGPHLYQSARVAAVAGLYGLLFGALAIWRRSLRPGILAHVWSDVAARLLRI